MHRPDQLDEGHDLPAGVPELPIPRPGEGSAERTPKPKPIAPPRLGGGASFTAAGVQGPATEQQISEDLGDVGRERLDAERFTWELASRLTAGMLSNPARNQSSVKDAMALFDQFLQEMHAYARIASEFDLNGADVRRRRHSDYFHAATSDQAAPASAGPPPPVPKRQPAQPAPMSGYQPLPPGARTIYLPGSMAGSAPPTPDSIAEPDEDAA